MTPNELADTIRSAPEHVRAAALVLADWLDGDVLSGSAAQQWGASLTRAVPAGDDVAQCALYAELAAHVGRLVADVLSAHECE